jgi:dolichol-phosphate mannosyltransferase
VPEKIVVTPTYNERGNIEKLLPDLLAFDPELEVVVVDDRSPDGTADAAEAIARERWPHPRRAAECQGGDRTRLQGGLQARSRARRQDHRPDGPDFSHPIDSLRDFFASARDYDLILGSRYLDGITVVRWPIERF